MIIVVVCACYITLRRAIKKKNAQSAASSENSEYSITELKNNFNDEESNVDKASKRIGDPQERHSIVVNGFNLSPVNEIEVHTTS